MLLRTSILALALALSSGAALPEARAAAPVIDARVPDGLSDDDMAEIVDFVVGNAVFALYHQAGHMMAERLGTIDTERGADQFATMTLLNPRSGAGDQTLVDAIDSWKLAGEDMVPAGGPNMPLRDRHRLDTERANALICDMVGADVEGFADIADASGLTVEARKACAATYSRDLAAWTASTSPLHRQVNAKPVPLPVVYDDVEGEDMPEATILKDNRVLEEVADRLANSYALPAPPTLRATTCGEPTSRFDAAKNEFVLCYELSAEHGQMILRDIARRN